ncbi:MAG: replication initiation protein [Arcicella sp.]|jgi:plasmid replication initiation protein|nr:replication initiation protein [Arcicella sp.]
MDNQEISKREQALIAISKDPFRVIKGNPLIEAKFELTPIQTKLFLFLLAKLDTSKANFEPMIVVVKDFQKFIGTKGDSLYNHLKKEVEKMIGKRVYYKDDKVELNSSLISGYLYLENEGAFLVEFPSLLKPFLLQLKENFTVIDIRNILGLDSSYAMRFYEICKEKERFKTFQYTVSEIKEMFAIENKYKNYFDFKVKIIIQARNELQENSELYFDFEEIKQGKKVVAIRFTVIKNKKNLKREDDELSILTKELPNHTETLIKDIFETVKSFDVSLVTVKNWFEKYPYLQIKHGIDYTLLQYKKGKVNNVASYLQKMVSAIDITEKQTKIKTEKKVRLEQEKQVNTEQTLITQQISQIKNDYFIDKKALAKQLLETKPNLFAQIIEELRDEVQVDKNNLLAELAIENYKPILGTKHSSFEEFVGNFNRDGTFQSYVLGKMTPMFQDFQMLRESFIIKAKQLGIREIELF